MASSYLDGKSSSRAAVSSRRSTQSGEDRSEEDSERAICNLPTVMPLPSGPSSSKALSKASPNIPSDDDDDGDDGGGIMEGAKDVIGAAKSREDMSVGIIAGIWNKVEQLK